MIDKHKLKQALRRWQRRFLKPYRVVRNGDQRRFNRYFNTHTWNDRWIIEEVFPGMRNGFFVDVGAFHPVNSSSTYLLERELGWTGILIEPNPDVDFSERRRAVHVRAGVSSRPETLDYWMLPAGSPQNGRNGFPDRNKDGSARWWRDQQEMGIREDQMSRVRVACLPLADILEQCRAPAVIDYLSVDIEGSEWEVFREFPFDRYSFRALSIEGPDQDIRDLFLAHGYREVANRHAENDWDLHFLGP
jgi:FkbM family methyltransferase